MDVSSLRLLIPVLNRPHRVQPTIDSAIAATPGLQLEQLLFVADPGDASEIRALDAAKAITIRAPTIGNYAQKVNAAAHVAFAGGAKLLFIGADDLDFKPGWFDAACQVMRETDSAVVGVNDLIKRQRDHATHFLVRAEYLKEGTIDRPGHLLHEGYGHCFVDDEFIATAKHRGTYRYAKDAHVEHLHPLAKKAQMDSTYRRGMRTFTTDQQIFKRREPLWR